MRSYAACSVSGATGRREACSQRIDDLEALAYGPTPSFIGCHRALADELGQQSVS